MCYDLRTKGRLRSLPLRQRQGGGDFLCFNTPGVPVDIDSEQCEHACMWRKDEVVEMLRKKQGKDSLRKFAGRVGCSAAYLSDVYRGKRDPGPKLLDHLNLQREEVVTVTYVKRRWR